MPIIVNNKILLSPDDKKRIEKDSRFILDSLNITRPPIPIITVARLTIPKAKVEFNSKMPHQLRGCAVVHQHGCDILINPNYPETSQRYSVGHEVGHLLRDESGMHLTGPQLMISPEIRFKESRANYYAACLLMPEWMVKGNWDFFHDIGTLANIFKVSNQAMIIRLKKLGLISATNAETLLLPYSQYNS